MAPIKILLPFPLLSGPAQPALELALKGCATLFSAPAGYLLTSRLSGLLNEHIRPVIWLRAGSEDRDPATLLISLANGAEAVFPGAGRRILERMRERPGPVFGWAPLFSELAHNIQDVSSAKPGLVLVIQHLDELFTAQPALGLLYDVFLPSLPTQASSILVSHVAPPNGSLPGYITPVSGRGLRLEEADALALITDFFYSERALSPVSMQANLPITSLRRMVILLEGCASALDSMCLARSWLSDQAFRQLIDTANSRVDLLTRVSRSCLQLGPGGCSDLLGLASRLEYMHSDLAQAALHL